MSFENQIKEILKARLEGTATEEELAILREWLDRSPQNRELAELLEESAENLPLLGRIYGYDEQRVWGNIRKAARKRRMRMLAATARKYAAVAAVAALLAGGGWWTLGRRAERLARQAYIEQLTPGVRGAVLTLSSGENVALEAGGRRMLVEQDGTRLEIAGEELAYHKVEAEQEIPMTNTVTVPRGKEFSLRLSDGTQVWLNSESSLVFPVRFGDGPREVTVTGEAYFDVAHDASRRFVVHADTVSVSVYGTAFNISSYADEGAIETTLVRGRADTAAQCSSRASRPAWGAKGLSSTCGRSPPKITPPGPGDCSPSTTRRSPRYAANSRAGTAWRSSRGASTPTRCATRAS